MSLNIETFQKHYELVVCNSSLSNYALSLFEHIISHELYFKGFYGVTDVYRRLEGMISGRDKRIIEEWHENYAQHIYNYFLGNYEEIPPSIRDLIKKEKELIDKFFSDKNLCSRHHS